MNYEAYVIEDDFNRRRDMIIPLIVDEMINERWKSSDWKFFYDKYYHIKNYTHKDAVIAGKKELDERITGLREILTPHIYELVDTLMLGNFLYCGEKHLKSKTFMLRYLIHLTDLEDRIMLYDAYKNKKSISKNIIKKLYDDIYYKFVTLRLPYTRQEQEEWNKRQGFYNIDYYDDKREKEGLFTRRQLTEDELKLDPNDLFINVLPKLIFEKNTELRNLLEVKIINGKCVSLNVFDTLNFFNKEPIKC